jgi:hypothetical protein
MDQCSRNCKSEYLDPYKESPNYDVFKKNDPLKYYPNPKYAVTPYKKTVVRKYSPRYDDLFGTSDKNDLFKSPSKVIVNNNNLFGTPDRNLFVNDNDLFGTPDNRFVVKNRELFGM